MLRPGNGPACKPFKSRFTIPYSLLGLLDINSEAFQCRMLLSLISLLQVLGIKVPDVGHTSFILQGDAQCVWDPSWLWVAPEGGVFSNTCLCLSYSPPNGVFIFCGGGAAPLIFRGNWSICRYRLGVSLGKGEFRIFLCYLLSYDTNF